ncbi:choice-of-anchor Q domain-containing protein [Scytonema sp. NUACC26]|uniref:choice-of-anchor Q domain-containing protein n=1 Tax=Scytonema sp. NUACC26 TaxID=3140176 RepID=UPI0034DC6738
MFNDTNGTARARNTIIASNLLNLGGVNPDVSGNFTSDGYNLIGDPTGSSGFGSTGDIVGTSTNPIDPLLDSLRFNGGSTPTFAFRPGSPAINAADRILLPTDPTTDQRGNSRISGGRADIGAFEFSFA